jgi:hypothetical protein
MTMTTGSNGDGLNLEQYKLDLTQVTVKTVFDVYAEEKRKYGELFAKELLLGIIASLICTTMYHSLTEPTADREPVEGEDQEGYEMTRDSFLEMREAIENTVSSAFTGAVNLWNPDGRNPEYCCEIAPVPEPGKFEH